MTKMEGQLLVMEVEQHTGIEPASSAWKADMFPLHQCYKEVGMSIPA